MADKPSIAGPDRDQFAEWCDTYERTPDRAALRDFLGQKYPVRYPDA